jgi:aminopeptidase N
MVYERSREPDAEYSISPQDIARRSLKNVVLAYLMQSDDDEATQLCLNQYGEQHNMTDVITALSLIADSHQPEREEVLSDFEQRWSGDALVMDKWFTAQALSSRDDTLDHVKQLMQHRAFSIRNPNKVRSLIGAFCGSNHAGFHRSDGAGYEFLADQVIQLDELNPQVASRMVRIMSRWKRYDEQRKTLMKQQLERIVSRSGVSKDVYEIAAKSLKD